MSNKNDDGMRLNPAALGAFANNDIANFIVAATPGGIEAQEAQGQATFVTTESLPKPEHFNRCTKEQFEKLGFVFGKEIDDLFIECTLPDGWNKEACEHSMWSKIVDEKGRERASIFYKAAFYDRNTSISLYNFFKNEYFPEKGWENYNYNDKDAVFIYQIKDAGEKVIFEKKLIDKNYDSEKETWKKLKTKMDKKYPNWDTNPLLYWD